MTMASSPSYLFIANASSVLLACRWAYEDPNSTDFIIEAIWSSSAQFLDRVQLAQVLSIWYFQTFYVPSLGFVLSYVSANGLATEKIDKQVCHHGWHHYDNHSCVDEGDKQFHQHTITVCILCS